MYCSHCGTEISDNDRFCFKCGKKVIDENQNSLNMTSNTNNDLKSQNKAVDEVKTGDTQVDNKKPPEVELKKISKYGLLSFITSFFLVIGSIPSIIFGIISIRKNKTEKTGIGLAVTGIIISSLTLLIFIIVILSIIYRNVYLNYNGGAV